MAQDGYQFGFNTTLFPLPGTGSLTDPVTNTILRYAQNIIQINMGAAFAADAQKCGFLESQRNYLVDGDMVPQAVSYPVSSTLKTTNYKFPLLSCHRLTREFEQFSSMRLMIKSNYILDFILPPLEPQQYNYLYKYLTYVSDVIVQRFWQGYDPNYNNGEQVWRTANIAFALLDKEEHGSFLGDEGKISFPSARIKFTIMEESQQVNANYPSMSNIFVQTNMYDGYNLSLPVDNIADGYVNPNLSIIGLETISGPVGGGTVVVISGTAFTNVIPSQTSTFAVTFNGAPAAKVVVKTNQTLLVLTGPGPATGTGDVVVTDRLGHVATLHNGWTFT